MKHQPAPALSCLGRGRILGQVSPGEMPKHLRYQHRGRNTAGTSTEGTRLLGAAPEHLRRLHWEGNTAGTTPGHHLRSLPGSAAGPRCGPGSRAGPCRAGTERSVPVWPGRSPGDGEPGRVWFQPPRGQRERRPRRSEPVLKVKWLRAPELVLLAGNNALLLAHLPLHRPGSEKGGGARAAPLLRGSRGAVPRRDRERLEKQRRPGLK